MEAATVNDCLIYRANAAIVGGSDVVFIYLLLRSTTYKRLHAEYLTLCILHDFVQCAQRYVYYVLVFHKKRLYSERQLYRKG